MFKNFFGKNKKNELYSPVTGKQVPLESVNDPVFSTKMMGDGIAISPIGDLIVSPCNGKIEMIANTKHAIGIITDTGVEILIHIGLNTVNLNGEGFRSLMTEGSKLKVGDPLIKLDLENLNFKEVDLTTLMIITNTNKFDFSIVSNNETVLAGESIVIDIK